ncbi:sterol desaturase family protein [Legionella brunensis]|uniref:Sterol desaturase n=1 Tax=Legionella brunensis TaxID=29422 RepID=A0A0W0SKJ9_9GAMM|nr:sterol desaturase family protein [Legionella brunensis]KTC83777.1 sterol desaturase [Legionella brunensis]
MLQQNEVVVRLGFFFGILLLMFIWELFAPKRQLSVSKTKRWISNLSIVVIDSAVTRLLFPAAAVGVAIYAQQNNMGLFNHMLHLNYWLTVIFSVIILDFAIYLQHVMFHAIPLFWRVHRMHHVDLDFDVTTGIRFHPIEIILSLFIKFCVIILLGAPALGVLIFEVLLNASSMFNHGNIRIPFVLDKIIRWIVVTPDMHRIHHSDIPNETNSNFGFNFSIWDRVFGTYTDQPRLGHEKMTIGIKAIRECKYCINLLGMLWIPFIRENREYPINRKNAVAKDD